MNKARAIAGVMVTGASTLAGVTVGTAPASAAVGDQSCDAGELCLWKNDTYSGYFRDRPANSADSDWSNGVGDTWNSIGGGWIDETIGDRVSSIKNASDRFLVFWQDSHYNGWTLCVPPQTWVPDLREYVYDLVLALPGDMGDAISSHRSYASAQAFLTDSAIGVDDRHCDWTAPTYGTVTYERCPLCTPPVW